MKRTFGAWPFSERLSQGWPTTLSNAALLAKDDLTRGGRRRYYRVADEALPREVISSTRTLS